MARIGYVDVNGILVPAWSAVGQEEIERRERIERENIAWVRRLAPVVFGHYAWREGEICTVESAGCGIYVEPRFGLSAAHVSTSFEALDDRIEGMRRRFTPLDTKYTSRLMDCTAYSTLVYQLPNGYDGPRAAMGPLTWPSPDAADSHVLVDWASADTDITTIQTAPTSPGAFEVEKQQQFFEWQMLPPPIGSRVLIFGLPGRVIFNHGDRHTVLFNVHGDVANVASISPVVRDCGSWKFPGFTLDREFEHGMSGAAVFYDNALVGIFSGPDYVASLWPLALHRYVDGKKNSLEMASLFDTGAIVVRDWPAVKGRVRRVPCTETAVEDPCSTEHAILDR
jgi:hypothetical protein